MKRKILSFGDIFNQKKSDLPKDQAVSEEGNPITDEEAPATDEAPITDEAPVMEQDESMVPEEEIPMENSENEGSKHQVLVDGKVYSVEFTPAEYRHWEVKDERGKVLEEGVSDFKLDDPGETFEVITSKGISEALRNLFEGKRSASLKKKSAGKIPGIPDGTGPYGGKGRGLGPGGGRGDGSGLQVLKKKKFPPGKTPGIPDGTGPYGRGLGPGKGKGDGSGLKVKVLKSEDGDLEGKTSLTFERNPEIQKKRFLVEAEAGLAQKFEATADAEGISRNLLINLLMEYFIQHKSELSSKLKSDVS